MKFIAPLFAMSMLALSAPEALADQPAPDQAQVEQQYAKMQEQMKLMQSQMDEIGKTRDPQQRQRLMQEHMSSMQEMMSLLRGAPGGMMGCGQMNRWMPMQQHMMEQMRLHQHWMMQPPPSPPPARK
jgi:glucan phosphorylase